MSERIKNTLSSAIVTSTYPRSLIDIYLTVIESDGSDWSAGINAAGLALVDAGIVLKDMISACEVAITEQVGDSDDDLTNIGQGSDEQIISMEEEDRCTPLVDPNRDESIGYGVPRLSIAVLPKLEKIIAIEVSGRLHLTRLEAGLEAGKRGAKEMAEIFDNTVKRHLAEMNEMQN